MFTGIIHHTGLFKGYRQGKQEIAVEAPSIIAQIEIGESLAVNGVCLSLIKKENKTPRNKQVIKVLTKYLFIINIFIN